MSQLAEEPCNHTRGLIIEMEGDKVTGVGIVRAWPIIQQDWIIEKFSFCPSCGARLLAGNTEAAK